jgi:hypothetical protein
MQNYSASFSCDERKEARCNSRRCGSVFIRDYRKRPTKPAACEQAADAPVAARPADTGGRETVSC